MLIGFLYFTETTCQPRYVYHKIQTFYYCVSLSCIVQIYNLTVTIVFQKYIQTFLCKQKLVNDRSIPSKQHPCNHDSFSKILRPSTALQSRSFLKNIKSFLCKQKIVNTCSIPSTHADRKITVCSHRHSFTPYPSLSPY